MGLLKWFLKLILGFIIITVIFAVTLTVLLSKNVTPPEVDAVPLNMEELLKEEIDNLILDSNTDKTISFEINENLINYEIEKLILEEFEDYLSANDNYLVEVEDVLLVQGGWVEFKEDLVSINLGIHVKSPVMVFKTRILLSLKVLESSPEKLVFKIDKIKLGKMPLKWILNIAPGLVKRFLNFDVEQAINEVFNNIGTFDVKKQQLTIDVKSLVANNEEGGLLASVLQIAEEEELIIVGINKVDDDYVFLLSADLNKIKSNKTPLELTEAERLKTEAEFNAFIESKVLVGLINNKISLNDKEFLKVFDYFLIAANDKTGNKLIEEPLFEDYNLKVLVPYFELTNKAYLNVPILIGTNTDNFKVNITLETEFFKDGNDLTLKFTNAEIGEVLISDELLKEILLSLNDSGVTVTDTEIVIPDFFSHFEKYDINITNIIVSDNKINFIIESLDVSLMLNDIILNFTNPDVVTIAQDLLDAINNEDDIEELLDDLAVEFDNLTEQEQEELMDLINQFLNE